MIFSTNYNNMTFYLYDNYFDNKEQRYTEIFQITDDGIILRYNDGKKYFQKNYLKNLI